MSECVNYILSSVQSDKRRYAQRKWKNIEPSFARDDHKHRARIMRRVYRFVEFGSSAEESHDAWVSRMMEKGYRNGDRGNDGCIPNLLPFAELPEDRQAKERLYSLSIDHAFRMLQDVYGFTEAEIVADIEAHKSRFTA